MIKNPRLKLFIDFLCMTFGAATAAFAIEEFLVPCTILDGGVVGIGIIISTLSKIPLSILTICLNIPFLIFGAKKLGKMFIIKSAYSMAVFSVFLEVFAPLQNVTQEYLLAVCFGGVILGAGVGIVIKFGGCLDGTETAAILINKKFHFSVGGFVLICNVIIFAFAGIVLNSFDRAMYSLLTYFITSKILGINFSDKENPLSKPGFLFTMNQMLYLLIVMWAFNQKPEAMLMLFAMVFGAHLLPFAWLYESRTYLVTSIVTTFGSMIISIFAPELYVGLFMIVCQIVMSVLLMIECRKLDRAQMSKDEL